MLTEHRPAIMFPFQSEKVMDVIDNFRVRYDIDHILAISGGSENGEEYTRSTIRDFVEILRNQRIAILTGGTEGGVPGFGTKLAREVGLPTVGVFPQEGRKYALFDDLDMAIETAPPTIGPASFGSETPSFAALADGVTVIGGSFGTLVEVATILKNNKGKIKKGLILVYIGPISGSGGVADVINCLPDLDKVRDSLPNSEIKTGQEAAIFMITKLGTRTNLH